MRDIKILPYTKIDGIPTLRDSDLYDLYLRLCCEEKLETVFYDGGVQSPDDFLNLFQKGNNWLYIFVAKGADKPLGFFWINHFEGYSCRVHFCMFKEAGRDVIRLGKMCLEYLGDYFKLVRGVTPSNNKLACKFIVKCGMIPLGEEPDRIYNYYENRTEPALISYYQGSPKEV